jgi:hypothetical protein
VKRAALIVLSSLLGAFTALEALSNSNDQVPLVWVSASPGYLLVAAIFNQLSEWQEDALWICATVANAAIYGFGSHLLLWMIAKRRKRPSRSYKDTTQCRVVPE